MNSLLKSLISPLLSIILALLFGTVILLASGINPIEAYLALIYGAFGSMPYFGDTLSRATPIILTGLAVGFGFKGGLFNIGAEGQLLVGAMSAAVVGYKLENTPPALHLIMTLIAAVVASSLWALIPALLKSLKGVHEVISTIMMNYIALNLGGYLIETLRVGELSQTPETLIKLPYLSTVIPGFEGSNVNFGLFIAIFAAAFMYFLVYKTVFGYETVAMGFNPKASEDGGINIKLKVILVMLISGALAGLGGAERVLGVHHSYLSGISPGLGFEGIAVALLANNNPIGIIFSAILFGALASGGQYMYLAADVPIDIVDLLQGLIVLFAACQVTIKPFSKRRKAQEVPA